jgi:hypothetical protein
MPRTNNALMLTEQSAAGQPAAAVGSLQYLGWPETGNDATSIIGS